MDDKDGITLDDIEIDLGNYGAQGSTMIDTLDTITLTSTGINTITLPSTSYSYSAGATLGGITSINNLNNSYTYSSNSFPPPTVSIHTDGIDIKDNGDIKIGNQSLKEFMVKMEERLAILVPDPAKLEKFQALKKAYEHYKLMEQLCQEQPKEEE
jgi:hypothetical protein